MGDNTKAPVIAGLAVGIAFVLVFSFVFASFTESRNYVFTIEGQNGFRPDRYEHVNISLNNLNEAYRVDQPIAFSAHFRGFTPMCDTAPTLKILKSETDKVMYDYNPLVLAMCSPDDFIDSSWVFGEEGDIVFYESGKYRLIVERYGQTVEKEFDVISATSGKGVIAEQVPEGQVIEVDIHSADDDVEWVTFSSELDLGVTEHPVDEVEE